MSRETDIQNAIEPLLILTVQTTVVRAWRSTVGARSDLEESMLEMADDVQPNSRLACQIKMTDELDGLVVRIPDGEY